MAKKIFKGVGGLLGIGKKKKAPVEETGPKITALNPEEVKKKRMFGGKRPGDNALGTPTLLSDKLGGYGKLG